MVALLGTFHLVLLVYTSIKNVIRIMYIYWTLHSDTIFFFYWTFIFVPPNMKISDMVTTPTWPWIECWRKKSIWCNLLHTYLKGIQLKKYSGNSTQKLIHYLRLLSLYRKDHWLWKDSGGQITFLNLSCLSFDMSQEACSKAVKCWACLIIWVFFSDVSQKLREEVLWNCPESWTTVICSSG